MLALVSPFDTFCGISTQYEERYPKLFHQLNFISSEFMQLISHPPQEYALDRSPNIVFTHQWWQL
jgi:hypothetical protein